ncbi:MAG TPA: glycosyltransferase, partial [Acidimicrobiales bacterium]|nr:glycosyltransferase [Acidimicrobiales bacterium]
MPTPVIRTFHHDEFAPEDLAAAKGDQRVSVCIPARDEEATVGLIVARIRKDLVDSVPLVDEVLVIDDHSRDRTAEVAAAAGARVVSAAEVLPGVADGPGKGEALWKSLWAAEGDLVAWCDADIRGFDARFVVGVLGPLLTRADVGFVKGVYDRPGDGEPSG